ncbi:RING/U-box superfamily protein [Euphorbia peplus]|nr:RING/U-box superfamily protein [Euphorbia peplus]
MWKRCRLRDGHSLISHELVSDLCCPAADPTSLSSSFSNPICLPKSYLLFTDLPFFSLSGTIMWGFASKSLTGTSKSKNECVTLKPTQALSECSDDEPSLNNSREEGLECPICWESFNIVENVPYALWCGHTLCKNCVLGLQRAVVKLPALPVQLPFFITCPWCSLLSLRLVYKGNLRFPCKNYFVLWMVESMNGDRSKSYHQGVCSSNRNLGVGNQGSQISNRRAPFTRTLEQSVSARVQGAKFPLIVIFLLVILYAIPVSAAILALYILITVLFAVPSFLILYFALPSLDWLVREIIN